MARMKKAIAQPLLEAVRPSEADGSLLSAVFSTYGLSLDQPNFFEHDFLPTLLGLGGVRDRGYAAPVALERKLKDAYTALICDAHALTEGGRPSLQVDLLPVGHKTQHAKVVLLHRKRLVRLVIGSANLTHEGYRHQREVAAVLDFKPEGKLPAVVLHQALAAWLHALGNVATVEVRKALRAAVDQAESWNLPDRLPADRSVEVVFGGGVRPLFQALTDAWPAGEPMLEWWVCSPFWPDPSQGRTPFEAVAEGLVERGASLKGTVLNVISCAGTPGENALPRFPFALVRRLRESGFPVRQGKIMPARLEVLPEEAPEEKVEGRRELHAKWVLLRGPETAVALLGSANFTRKGLGVMANPESANIEACVLLRWPAEAVNLERWMPPIMHRGVVDWAECQDGQLGPTQIEESTLPAWPDFIARMELAIGWGDGPDPVGTLRVVLRSNTCPDFRISIPTDGGTSEVPLSAASTQETECGTVMNVPLEAHGVRRLLTGRLVLVTWGTPSQSVRFPVNIEEQSKAGLPSVLGVRPDEQQLLAYFHGRITEEDLVDLLERQAERGSGLSQGVTPQEAERLRQLQNYLVREFVESLFGLADTLRQAMRSPRAFEQALVGDFSPACLAEQILQAFRSGRRSATATAFQLVELVHVVGCLELPNEESHGPGERKALEEARERGIRCLLQIAAQASVRPDFRAVCRDRDFASYVEACLPGPMAKEWSATVFQEAEPPGVPTSTESSHS